MPPEKYRRLWKRRLKRRPLLPFLLASLFVLDAVSVVTIGDEGPSFIDMLILGGVIAQLNLLGIWIASRRFGILPRLGYAMLLAAVLATAFEWALPHAPPGIYIAIFSSVLALSALVAGLSEAIASRWLSGIRRQYRLRFSIGFLLLATTVVPLLLAASAFGQWQVFLRPAVAVPFLIESLLVAVAIAIQHGARTAKWTAAIYLGMTVSIIPICFSLESRDQVLLSPGYYYGLLLCLGGFMTAIKVRGRPRATPIEKSEDQPTPPTPQIESIDLRG